MAVLPTARRTLPLPLRLLAAAVALVALLAHPAPGSAAAAAGTRVGASTLSAAPRTGALSAEVADRQRANTPRYDGLASTSLVAAERAADAAGPLAGTTYSPKVLSQMASGDAHAFPIIVDSAATWADAASAEGADGQWYLHVNVPGAVNGESGFYQYIVDQNGVINHRLWSGQSSIAQFWMRQQ